MNNSIIPAEIYVFVFVYCLHGSVSIGLKLSNPGLNLCKVESLFNMIHRLPEFDLWTVRRPPSWMEVNFLVIY